ncbi:MAG TPA: DEAD/DEAH box helicase, partial [Vicinamibacterales bacterium]|nr:DEAD/DEAH box helicase [Vicinamibacterales bacterium]
MSVSVNPGADALAWSHPLVREWFLNRFGSPTEPQEAGWPEILANRDALISAPTGSGKTLAAFLACIDRLVRRAADGTLTDRTSVLYVSPLKALGNDIQRNLDGPLAEITALAQERGLALPEIRTAVRTGDTLMPARQAMMRRPPHILVTTPESLYILLTSNGGRQMLSAVDTVIVDEIHAVADDKRGAHLALSLERLDALVGRPIPRIGLSATVTPIETMAQFLVGAGRPAPHLVLVDRRRMFDLAVDVPRSELGPIATHELWGEIYDRLAALVREHRSTIVFTNTRRVAERVAHHLGERLGEDVVAAHHGSLSRQSRLAAEQKLKTGQLRVVVATASLELGIDVGTIDLVCQIGSTRSIAVAVQRIGRAGHWRGAVPKARIFPTTRDDLVECAALVLAVRRGQLDRIIVPEAPLDILAQQIVAACAAEDWQEDDLYSLVRRAYPYRQLPRDDFDDVVEMLSEGIAARRGRYGVHLHRDKVNGRLRGRRGARLTAITGGGAIPDTALYSVVEQPEGRVVGTVDEDFAVESMGGDVFLLGNASWRVLRVGQGRVLVENAQGSTPTVPFWRGEAPARTPEFSAVVAEVRGTIDRLAPDAKPDDAAHRQPPAAAAVAWLQDECGLDSSGAEQIVDYIAAGRAVLGAVPTQTRVIAERFFDEGGGMQLVIHAPFGGRINRAWGLALRKRFCRSFNFELQAAATEDGINIALAEQHSFPLGDVFRFLSAVSVREVLEQAVIPAPVFGTRWRWDASRSLALTRFRGGRKVPLPIQRMQSDDLLATVFPDAAACQENIEGDIQLPNHPLIREVMKDVLTEAMDIEGLIDVLAGIADGRIECVAVDTPVPSQFSHEILNANPYAYLDDAPLEERRARAVQLRRVLPEAVLSEVGALDADAIEQVVSDAWPDVRDADELHDALLTLVALPAAGMGPWTAFADALATQHRAAIATARDRAWWVSAERVKAFVAIVPEATGLDGLPDVSTGPTSAVDARVAMVQGWMQHAGPVTAGELARRIGLDAGDVHEAMLRLEAAGSVLRGKFRDSSLVAGGRSQEEWCDRRLLARIHQLTLGRLRREIEPVAPAVFMRWLCEWQHVAPGTQVHGERGTLEVLRQLQGFEAPSNVWEPWLLSRRIANYDPAVLDQLCLTGAVGWGRLSPHPAITEHRLTARGPGTTGGQSLSATLVSVSHGDGGEHRGRRRVIPTSVAPITFFVREDADWMAARPEARDNAHLPGLSRQAGLVLQYLHKAGASFFPDLVRGTRLLKAEVETALWELAAAGVVTADGFDNLRALIDPRRRAGHGSGRRARPRHSSGRWSLLHAGEPPERARQLEATCQMLLRRYGVVFRELLARESVLPAWRDLLVTFRRLEDRGDVRGGRFLSGYIGEQFALPAAVESLRAYRRAEPAGQVITLNAADPLNLVGVILPGDRTAAIGTRVIHLRDGVEEMASAHAETRRDGVT